MPPKKAAASKADAGNADEAGKNGGKFAWTAENERKLLLFTHPFTTVTTAEFEKLLEHFPGTNLNGIKIRYSRLRVEKNKLAEEHGFAGMGKGATMAEDGLKETPKKTVARGKKRGADGEDVAATPAKKGKKSKAVEDEEDEEEAPGNVLIKEEEEEASSSVLIKQEEEDC